MFIGSVLVCLRGQPNANVTDLPVAIGGCEGFLLSRYLLFVLSRVVLSWLWCASVLHGVLACALVVLHGSCTLLSHVCCFLNCPSADHCAACVLPLPLERILDLISCYLSSFDRVRSLCGLCAPFAAGAYIWNNVFASKESIGSQQGPMNRLYTERVGTRLPTFFLICVCYLSSDRVRSLCGLCAPFAAGAYTWNNVFAFRGPIGSQ